MKNISAKWSGLLAAAVVVVGLWGTAYSGSAHGPHWGYAGEEGPDHWGELSKEFAACASGHTQSPIDLSGGKSAELPAVTFSYKPAQVKLKNNGHTLQADYEAGSAVTIGKERYELLQFHFHAHSEHSVGGKFSPLEMHLVHKSAAGELAVVGVMIEQGEENAALKDLWQGLPAHAGESSAEKSTVDAARLLPAERAMFRYNGSLTTPPCSEGVRWHVLRAPIEMSAEQIKAFTALFPMNARPVQPVHERVVSMN